MTVRFNPPPNWPEPPHDGWVPPKDWRPDPAWGPVPAGWRLWVEDSRTPDLGTPWQASEDVPATGARPRPRVDRYPVTALNPGMWSQNHLEDEDYGFGPAPVQKDRRRLRLVMAILSLVLAAVLVVATVLAVRWGIHYATEDLPTSGMASPAAAVAIDGPFR